MESAIAHDLESGEQRTSDVAAGSISFEQLNLNRHLSKCLQIHKFLTPTKIQAAAIPIAVAGMDLLVQSKSGTGKTLIYVLAALQMIDRSVPKPQALIIVPTRELAIQVEDTVNGLVSNMRLKNAYLSVSFIGGTDVKRDRIRMARGRVVVGTPGRLLHLMQNKVFNTSAIKLLVLDEADQLYATDSLQKDVHALIASLQPGSQIIACSATYPNALDERLAQLMNNPVLVSNSERATVLLGIRQFVYELPEQPNSMQEMLAKLTALHKIFAQLSYEQGILFASSQSRADSFRNYLQRDGVECDLMSGAMKQNERLETFQAYRKFKMRTMVATDLMARGVDSSHANLVINLDPPNDLVTYLHRIGRAGRFGSKGIAITFISSPKQCQNFKRIIADAGTGMSVLRFPTDIREGFDFWDYASYDFPFFQKTEAHEQEECELKRIKQRWKGPSGDEQPQNTFEITNENVNDTDANSLQHHTDLEELEKSAEKQITHNDKIEAVQIADIDKEQVLAAEQQLNAMEKIIDAKPILKPTEQVVQEISRNVLAPGKTQDEFVNATKIIVDNADVASNQPQETSNNVKNAPKTSRAQYEKRPDVQESPIELIELTPSTEMPAAAPNSINTKTYCLVAPTELSSTTVHPLGISNTVDDASSIVSDSMENDYDTDDSYSSCYSESDVRLIWGRALIQQKLQKRRKRNAGRRICIFNWRHCNLTRVATQSSIRKTKGWIYEPEKCEDDEEEEDNKDTHSEEWQYEQQDEEPLPQLKFKIWNSCNSNYVFKNDKLLSSVLKKVNFVHLLKKFNNFPQLQQRLLAYVKRTKWDTQKYEQWINQLYDSMQDLYYVDHNKSKQVHKFTLPEISSFDNYNRLMEFIRNTTCLQQGGDGEPEQQPPLSKLSVHVNQQMNIPPADVAPHNDNAEETNSEDSETGSSYVPPEGMLRANDDISENDSMGAESLGPYSSSGFVESTESASSGIDTSQYDTNSSMVLESDDYEEEEEEDETIDEDEFDDTNDQQSNASQTDTSSLSTLTADSENDTESESETEQQDDESAADISAMNDATAELALAQARWQNLFQMQYQFIANYVDNYMATYRRQQ